MAWVNIPDTALDPDAPLTSELAYAWRDNLIAVIEGQVGAPRVLDGGLSGTVTTAGQNWVANRLTAATVGSRVASLAAGSVGSIALLIKQTDGTIEFGDTVAASDLRPVSTGGPIGGTPPTVSGTWRCLGRALRSGSNVTFASTVFVRVS